jgi:serine/threonine-protein kinase HipA
MNCLLCYEPLAPEQDDYHPKCVARVFGQKEMPEFEIDEKKLKDYAKQVVGASQALTGVQPKLSLWLEKAQKETRFTFIGDKSNYIIKPQSEAFLALPQNEDLCMHLAADFGLEVATHGLVRLKSGSLAYLAKRFDREGANKTACEDLCQLSENLTEHKYRGSYEKAGKTIRQYSTQPGLDMLHYFKLVLVCFVTGNADMHLKNFSLLEKPNGTFCLSPFYDLVSTELVIRDDIEQTALSLNGKKNRIRKKDFDVLGTSLQLTEKQIQNSYQSLFDNLDKIYGRINHSFLPSEHKDGLQALMMARLELFRPG